MEQDLPIRDRIRLDRERRPPSFDEPLRFELNLSPGWPSHAAGFGLGVRRNGTTLLERNFSC